MYTKLFPMFFSQPRKVTGNNWYRFLVGGIFFLFVSKASSQTCPNVMPGSTNVGGVVNTYFLPNTSTLIAGSTTFRLLSATTAGLSSNISSGDLLLIIQMQDGRGTNFMNDNTYGTVDSTNAGLFEFVVATSSGSQASGSTISFVRADGTSGGIVNSYYQNPDDTTGRSTYQIIKVPVYTDVTLTSNIIPYAWDGNRGGVVALVVDGNTNFNSSRSIVATGYGFRGGAARSVNGAATTNIYRDVSVNHGALKGEGISGTPSYVVGLDGLTTITTSTYYPKGSYMIGSPGNAGGGSKDDGPQPSLCSYAPNTSDFGAGGGGGSNVGTGGHGGRAWCTGSTTYGLGGKSLGYSSRLFMGGGGGAGHGQSDEYGSGASGGGIIFFFTTTVSNTTAATTISANGGSNAVLLNQINAIGDGGGGGGGGGSIYAYATTNLGTLSLYANGSAGGYVYVSPNAVGPLTASLDNQHGPGGGGGGGKIWSSSTSGSVTASGGIAGRVLSDYDDDVGDFVDVGSYGAIDGDLGTVGEASAPVFPAPCLLLPVNFVHLSGVAQNNNIRIAWKTEMESGNYGFNIQHSNNRIHWTKVGFVPPRSVSNNQPLQYVYLHTNVSTPVNYYRIEQIDTEGAVSYSHVIRVNMHSQTSEIKVFPNPAYDKTGIKGLKSGDIVSLLTQDGKLVKTLSAGSDYEIIPINNLPPGLYYVNVIRNGQHINLQKLVLSR